MNHKVTDAALDLVSELEVVFKQALDTHLHWRKQALEQNRLAALGRVGFADSYCLLRLGLGARIGHSTLIKRLRNPITDLVVCSSSQVEFFKSDDPELDCQVEIPYTVSRWHKYQPTTVWVDQSEYFNWQRFQHLADINGRTTFVLMG